MPNATVKKNSVSPTSGVLPFSYIRDGVIVMKDGSLRGLLLASSINFYLKSETEQQAVISGYVGFLNTLNFPLQIVVQSRPLNIDSYLNDLNDIAARQTNELLRMQTADYRQFVKELLELEEIMTKRFYVVVPYDPAGDRGRGWLSRLTAAFFAPAAVSLREEKLRRYREELQKRLALVQNGLGQIGVTTVALDSPALIELMYRTYNQPVADLQRLNDVAQVKLEE